MHMDNATVSRLTLNIMISTLGALIHSVALSFLYSLRRKGTVDYNQRILIFNLGICGLLQCLVQVLHEIMEVSPINREILHDIRVVQFTGLSWACYMIMYAIILDKLAHVLLDIKYPIIISESRVRNSMAVIWTIAILGSLPFLCLHVLRDWEPLLPILIGYVTGDLAYLLVSVSIYIFIFRKFQRSRIPPCQLQGAGQGQSETVENKRAQKAHFRFFKSSFFPASLLVASFVAFTIIPNLIYVLPNLHALANYDINGYLLVSYELSWLINSFIYILAESKLRREMYKYVHEACGCNSRSKVFPQSQGRTRVPLRMLRPITLTGNALLWNRVVQLRTSAGQDNSTVNGVMVTS